MQKQARTEMKMKMKNIHTNSNQTSMKWQQQKRTGSYIYVTYLYMIAILCMAVLLVFFFFPLSFRYDFESLTEQYMSVLIVLVYRFCIVLNMLCIILVARAAQCITQSEYMHTTQKPFCLRYISWPMPNILEFHWTNAKTFVGTEWEEERQSTIIIAHARNVLMYPFKA